MSEIQSATSKAVTIIRVTSGNFFEMFDFFLFGFFDVPPLGPIIPNRAIE